MGIRIHKTLGYGFNDFKYENGAIVDDRINPNGYLPLFHEDDGLAEEKYSLEKYKTFLQNKIEAEKDDILNLTLRFDLSDIDELTNKKRKRFAFYNSITHEPEFRENVLLFLPPFNEGWHRYDDVIDYYEELSVNNNSDLKDKLVEIKGGIYPYNGSYINLKTLGRPDSLLEDQIKIDRIIDRMLRLNDYEIPEEIKAFLEKGGFDDIEDFQKSYVPVVPRCIVAMCEFLEIFKDPKIIYTMKPYYFSYWS